MNEEFRLADPGIKTDEEDLEISLRPRRFEDFVGQPKIKEQLRIFIEAAQTRGEALDHHWRKHAS